MRCERAHKLYSDYSAHSLGVATMSLVDEHLASCPNCREYYEIQDQLAALLRAHGGTPHPGPAYFESLSERVLGELERRPTPGRVVWARALRQPLWWSGMAAAAALVAVGLAPLTQLPGGAAGARMPQARIAMLRETPPNLTPPAAARPTAPPAVPLVTTGEGGATGKVLAKGVNAPEGNLRGERLAPELAAGHSRTPSELQAAREAETQLASLRRQATRPNVSHDRLLEQIQLIKTQLIFGSNQELRAHLQELEATVRGQVNPEAAAEMPMVRQANLYLKGEDELAAGRTDEALASFQRVLLVDETTLLATRANLQMGDLLYSEQANFKQALEHYKRCTGKPAGRALNSAERQRVERMVEVLERYSEDCFRPLARAHSVRRQPWPEALAALRELVAIPDAEPLLPEVARALVDRLAAGDRPAPETLLAIYRLLADKTAAEQGDMRSYLELYLGDMAVQLAQPEQAIAHFLASTGAAEGSLAARMARARLNELEEQSLQNLARNRN